VTGSGDWLLVGALAAVLVALAVPLGGYLACVHGGGAAPGDRFFTPIERIIYRLVGVDETREQHWTAYARAVLACGLVSVLLLYALQRFQGHLPANPTGRGAVTPSTAFNTAISFVTNTDWQVYAGESTMSHLTQMAGLAVQNFVSAAVGISVAVALTRGLIRRRSATIGNFWVDLIRTVVRVLLPVASVAGLVLASQGVIQNLSGGIHVRTLEGGTQLVPGGPVASQEAIKLVGTNGGGFFNANSAHPFENPTAFTNVFEIALMLIIPFSMAFMFGRLADNRKLGWALFATMFTLWIASAVAVTALESNGNRVLPRNEVTQMTTSTQSGGNLEGKEVRIGADGSGIFAASATGTSTGATNSAHDSFTPLAGGVVLANMMLGEVSPGGAGTGLYGLLMFALLAVFIAGLMVGRTPEFLGKKIQATEVKLAVLSILVLPASVLTGTAGSVLVDSATAQASNPGPHGFSEIVYAFTSTVNNNGSAFGGLTTSTDWYTTTLGLAMFAGRYLTIVATLAIAGAMAVKQPTPATVGTLRTDTPLFVGLLIGVVIIVSGLTFFPALSLGPIAEGLGR
jgi:K+-transporting ATPase ATPase A chain